MGTRRKNNVFITSTRRRWRRFDVMKTSWLLHYCFMCPLGKYCPNVITWSYTRVKSNQYLGSSIWLRPNIFLLLTGQSSGGNMLPIPQVLVPISRSVIKGINKWASTMGVKGPHPPRSGQGHSTSYLYSSICTVDELRASVVLHSGILSSLHHCFSTAIDKSSMMTTVNRVSTGVYTSLQAKFVRT